MAKVPAPFLEHLRSERETGQNIGLIVAEELTPMTCKDRRPGPRGDMAEEFELDPSITAAGGTTMVMATMALVTLMHLGPLFGRLEVWEPPRIC